MITDFHTLAPGDPLSRAVDLTLAGTQKDFPVLAGESIVGVLTQPRSCAACATRAPPAASSGHGPARTADVATPLARCSPPSRPPTTRLVCITRAGRLAGIVDLDNIAEYLRIQQALGPGR